MSEGKHGEPWVPGGRVKFGNHRDDKGYYAYDEDGVAVAIFFNTECRDFTIACVNAFARKEPRECVVVGKDELCGQDVCEVQIKHLNQANAALEKQLEKEQVSHAKTAFVVSALKAQLAVAREALKFGRGTCKLYLETRCKEKPWTLDNKKHKGCKLRPTCPIMNTLAALDSPEPSGVWLTKGEHEGLLDFISSDCGLCKSKELRDVKDFAVCVNCGTHLALAILQAKPVKEGE